MIDGKFHLPASNVRPSNLITTLNYFLVTKKYTSFTQKLGQDLEANTHTLLVQYILCINYKLKKNILNNKVINN